MSENNDVKIEEVAADKPKEPVLVAEISLRFMDDGQNLMATRGTIDPARASNFLDVIHSLYVDVQKAAMMQHQARKAQTEKHVVGPDGTPFYMGG